MSDAAEATVVIENCSVATVDGAGTEYEQGHVVVTGNRIAAVGGGSAPHHTAGVSRIDGEGCLLTPGLVNTHHHLYQWITRGYAQQANLFDWLTELYPVWSGLDADLLGAGAAAALGWLAMSGCTTSSDHHYVFPAGRGDLLEAEIAAAERIGVRFHPSRGSMDLGRSRGGLPPDDIVEDRDTVLAETEAAIGRFHDSRSEAMVRIAVAPCSPFSVSRELMRDAAELARRSGVRLHTHLAETVEEGSFCAEEYGCTPVEYVADLGWLGDDVWLAHGVHLDDAAIKRCASTGTGIAHCPSSNARLGSGIAPVRALLDAGAPVGLGVDGPASAESNLLVEELRQALYLARLRGGPAALDAREALQLGTMGGARCLGRADEVGSIEPGKLADLALWRLDGLGHADIADPVAALVLGPPAQLALLLVNGVPVVEEGELCRASAGDLARDARAAARHLGS